jgi:D-glycero-alpha-D-manno-heptose 1-phosphate guanylyltransferase
MAYALKSYHGTAPVLVLNGDSFVQVDYIALFAQHREKEARLTIVLREVADTARYGEVEVKDGIITSFGVGKEGKRALINAGVYVMQPQLFASDALPEAFSFERDFIPQHLAALRPQSFRAEDYFIDIGIPEDYARACKELPLML